MDNCTCMAKALEEIEKLNNYIDYLKSLPQTASVLALIESIREDVAWINETGFATEEEAIEFYKNDCVENHN